MVFISHTPSFAEITERYEKIPLGAALLKARLSLSTGKIDDGKAILAKLSKEPDLKDWADLYLVEAAIKEEKFAEARSLLSNLKKRALPPFATLYHRKLDLEISLLDDKKLDIKNELSLINEITNRQSRTLKPEMSYLLAVALCRQDKYLPCVRTLQDTRLRYPISMAGEKAYRYQNKILKKEFPNKNTLLNAAFWLNEVRVLVLQRKLSEAKSVWQSHSEPKSIAGYNKSLFDLNLKILKGTGDLKSLENFLDQASKKGSPVRVAALVEKVSSSWNKNNYPEVEKLLKEIGASPYTIYMTARIKEEQQKFDEAKKDFEMLTKITGHQYRFQAGLRLGMLQLRDGENNDAAKTLAEAKKHDKKENYYDSVALEYWLKYASAPKTLSTTASFKNDPRLYYYWLMRGAKIATPNIKIPTKSKAQSTSISKCSSGKVYLENEEKQYLRSLAQYGVSDILREELTFALRNDSLSAGQVRARAKFIKEIGSPAEGIKELRSSEDTYAILEKSCLGSLMEILYPKNFDEIFTKESKRTGVDKFLLMAITRTESAYDPLAISHSGAVGLMQLMPFTAELEGFTGYKEGKPENVFNPEINIALGANHLKRLLDKYGENWHLVIAAYNAGGEAVDRWLKRYPDTQSEVFIEFITYKETRNYVKKVLGAYWAYKMTEASS